MYTDDHDTHNLLVSTHLACPLSQDQEQCVISKFPRTLNQLIHCSICSKHKHIDLVIACQTGFDQVSDSHGKTLLCKVFVPPENCFHVE